MSAPTTSADPGQACLTSLVASLADNKAALGRRYAEWAISAPTLESAVAAAAMAQDELGHARSTYPVLKGLGTEAGDESLDGGCRRLAPLDGDLPDWPSLIAANLVIDGVLTEFVSACAESSVTPLAQRARKILQEETAHRVHAEAWAKRLCRGPRPERELLLACIEQMWEHASRWVGPDDDPGFEAARAAGMVGAAPGEIRRDVRGWLVELLAGEGLELTLPEPSDWSRWNAERRRLEP
jgi:1,2-phenylacetyl-CoA epoxidase catalytic subunit